jgi:glycosylphosphatidylinositol transamidase (GPIT) subunit GPI8
MYAALFLLLCLIGGAYSQNGDGVTWALLVAGSSEYMNYRHQVNILFLFLI